METSLQMFQAPVPLRQGGEATIGGHGEWSGKRKAVIVRPHNKKRKGQVRTASTLIRRTLANDFSGLKLKILSNDDMRKISVCKIDIQKSNHRNGRVPPSVLNVPTLGSINNRPCETCNLVNECKGHFGHIDLLSEQVPVPRPEVARFVLNIIAPLFCMKCYECIVELPEELPVSGMSPIVYLRDVKKTKLCPRCSFTAVASMKLATVSSERVSLNNSVDCSIMCRVTLRKLKKEDSTVIVNWTTMDLHTYLSSLKLDPARLALNISKFTDIMFEVLLVPPISLRPNIEAAGKQEMNADEKIDQQVAPTGKKEGRGRHDVDPITSRLMHLIRQILKGNALHVMAIIQIIITCHYVPSKKDRMPRKFIYGGMVAGIRITITPNTTGKFNSIEISRDIVDKITLPVTCGGTNIDAIRKSVLSGKVVSIEKDSRQYDIDPNDLPKLRLGDVVYLKSAKVSVKSDEDVVYWSRVAHRTDVIDYVCKDSYSGEKENIKNVIQSGSWHCIGKPLLVYTAVTSDFTAVASVNTFQKAEPVFVSITPSNILSWQMKFPTSGIKRGNTIVLRSTQFVILCEEDILFWKVLLFSTTVSCIEREDKIIDVSSCHANPTEGCIVHRKMVSGDVGTVNRAPTMSEDSILAMEIRSIDNIPPVARLPNSTCRTFNADYDGDEIHIYAEPVQADVIPCLIKSKPYGSNGTLLIALSASDILGLVLASEDKDALNHQERAWLQQSLVVDAFSFDASRLPPKNAVCTPLDILNTIFPSNFCYDSNPTDLNDANRLLILNGKLTAGKIPHSDKSSVGTWFHSLVMALDEDERESTVTALCHFSQAYVRMRGVSISFQDMCLNKEDDKRMQLQKDDILASFREKCDGLSKSVSNGQLTNREAASSMLQNAQQLFAELTEKIGKSLKKVNSHNNWFEYMCRGSLFSDSTLEMVTRGMIGLVGPFPKYESWWSMEEYAHLLEKAICVDSMHKNRTVSYKGGEEALRKMKLSHTGVQQIGMLFRILLFRMNLKLNVLGSVVDENKTHLAPTGDGLPQAPATAANVVLLRMFDGCNPTFHRLVKLIPGTLLQIKFDGLESDTVKHVHSVSSDKLDDDTLFRIAYLHAKHNLEIISNETSFVTVPIDVMSMFKNDSHSFGFQCSPAEKKAWIRLFAEVEMVGRHIMLASGFQQANQTFVSQNADTGVSWNKTSSDVFSVYTSNNEGLLNVKHLWPTWLRERVSHIRMDVNPAAISLGSFEFWLLFVHCFSPHWIAFRQSSYATVRHALDAVCYGMEIPWTNVTPRISKPTKYAKWMPHSMVDYFTRLPTSTVRSEFGTVLVSEVTSFLEIFPDDQSESVAEQYPTFEQVYICIQFANIASLLDPGKEHKDDACFSYRGTLAVTETLHKMTPQQTRELQTLFSENLIHESYLQRHEDIFASLVAAFGAGRLMRISEHLTQKTYEFIKQVTSILHKHRVTNFVPFLPRMPSGTMTNLVAPIVMSSAQSHISAWKSNGSKDTASSLLRREIFNHKQKQNVLFPANGQVNEIIRFLAPCKKAIATQYCIGYAKFSDYCSGIEILDSEHKTNLFGAVYTLSPECRGLVTKDSILRTINTSLHVVLEHKRKNGSKARSGTDDQSNKQELQSIEETFSTETLKASTVFHFGRDDTFFFGLHFIQEDKLCVPEEMSWVFHLHDGIPYDIRRGFLSDSDSESFQLYKTATRKSCVSMFGIVVTMSENIYSGMRLCLHVSEYGIVEKTLQDIFSRMKLSYETVCCDERATVIVLNNTFFFGYPVDKHKYSAMDNDIYHIVSSSAIKHDILIQKKEEGFLAGIDHEKGYIVSVSSDACDQAALLHGFSGTISGSFMNTSCRPSVLPASQIEAFMHDLSNSDLHVYVHNQSFFVGRACAKPAIVKQNFMSALRECDTMKMHVSNVSLKNVQITKFSNIIPDYPDTSQNVVIVNQDLPNNFLDLPCIDKSRSFHCGNRKCAIDYGITATETVLLMKLAVLSSVPKTNRQMLAAWVTQFGKDHLITLSPMCEDGKVFPTSFLSNALTVHPLKNITIGALCNHVDSTAVAKACMHQYYNGIDIDLCVQDPRTGQVTKDIHALKKDDSDFFSIDTSVEKNHLNSKIAATDNDRQVATLSPTYESSNYVYGSESPSYFPTSPSRRPETPVYRAESPSYYPTSPSMSQDTPHTRQNFALCNEQDNLSLSTGHVRTENIQRDIPGDKTGRAATPHSHTVNEDSKPTDPLSVDLQNLIKRFLC